MQCRTSGNHPRCWTSCATDSHVTITAHHISPDWELKMDEDTPLTTEMKKAFKNDFEKRYTHLEDLLHTASALDPHFKTLPFLSDEDTERIFLRISAEATALFNKGMQTARDTFRGMWCRETLLIQIHTTG